MRLVLKRRDMEYQLYLCSARVKTTIGLEMTRVYGIKCAREMDNEAVYVIFASNSPFFLMLNR